MEGVSPAGCRGGSFCEGGIFAPFRNRKYEALFCMDCYFSCVVFLSIVVIHIGDANPYLFVFNRVMDTMIGIIIGMLVNSVRLPRRKGYSVHFRYG